MFLYSMLDVNACEMSAAVKSYTRFGCFLPLFTLLSAPFSLNLSFSGSAWSFLSFSLVLFCSSLNPDAQTSNNWFEICTLNKYATHNSLVKRRVYYNICTELYMCCILEWEWRARANGKLMWNVLTSWYHQYTEWDTHTHALYKRENILTPSTKYKML